jgi:hypothetical protein
MDTEPLTPEEQAEQEELAVQLFFEWGQDMDLEVFMQDHPDTRLDLDCQGDPIFCSPKVNGSVSMIAMENCTTCAGRPTEAWFCVTAGKQGQLLYSDPPCVVIADPNPKGFGVVPRPNWEEHLEALGIAEFAVIKSLRQWLRGHAPVNYLGDDSGEERKGQLMPGEGLDDESLGHSNPR